MNTYTVREPGCCYWWRGTRFREARAALREAHARGLRGARIYRTREDWANYAARREEVVR